MQFKEITAENTSFRVSLNWIGEGISGDFDKQNKDDKPLIRFNFDVKEDEQWTPLDDASYCTPFTIHTPPAILQILAERLLFDFSFCVAKGSSVKKICEHLSIIDEQMLLKNEVF
jgi:hypothetical protein